MARTPVQAGSRSGGPTQVPADDAVRPVRHGAGARAPYAHGGTRR
ncbi:hypothetical protein [Streptomyces albireticuli]|nr:hypothetical protein [Streptomyces albireticuli]